MALTELVCILRHLADRPESPDQQLVHRFVTGRDQDAFTALVNRHATLVWNVCQRVLHHRQDAEDAFQATFVVLARRAGSISKPHLLGNWLYGVAYRTALAAKRRAMKRRMRERPLSNEPPHQVTADPIWSDVRAVLDAEIARLPAKYRVAVILCYLEGNTNAETARLLGCPVGTVMSRLAWARERLRSRLSWRGVTLTGTTLTTVFAAQDTVSAALVGSTTAAAAYSAEVISLTTGVLHAMRIAKIKKACLGLFCLSLTGVALAGVFRPARAQPEGKPAQAIIGKKPDIAELADVLNIVRKSGLVTLRDGHQDGYLLIEFYKEGKKQDRTIRGAGYSLGDLAKRGRFDQVEFAVQALDLDLVQLGDGKRGHCRMRLVANVVGPSAPFGMSTQDVPKELFDFARATSGGYFPAEASSGNVIPLFYIGYGPDGFAGGLSVQRVVEANAKGNVAIVSLHVDADE
jgi:RNA polymerase sigma factor (sigma-70 family)